jgi:hypothetical protein
VTEPTGERLACGAVFGALVDQVADDLPGGEHEAGCPHCQAALAELRSLWDATRMLAAEELDVPEGLDAAVLRRVRREKFLRDAFDLLAGTLPRLSLALFTYTGLLRRPGEQIR